MLMACQVGFSALSFLTAGSYQTESWASARHLYLIVCLLDMMLSSMLCLVPPHLSNTTPGMREVIAKSSTSPVSQSATSRFMEMQFPQEGKTSVQMLSCQILEVYLKEKKKKAASFLTGILGGEVSSSFHGFSIKGIVHRVYI